MSKPRFFEIEGYFIDDPDWSLDGCIVTDTDGCLGEEDSPADAAIFFYGLSEEDLKEAVEKGENVWNEFAVTAYKEIGLCLTCGTAYHDVNFEKCENHCEQK